MKPVTNRRLRVLSSIHRGLIICCVVLVLVFGGSVIYWALSTKPVPSSYVPVQGQTFTGIGRVRVSTADYQPGVVILFVIFNYNPDDRVFSEELVLRIRDFRDIITEYIGSFSMAELHSQDEEVIRAELLRRFNAILRLGQIETLFFSDFMIIG